MTNVIFLPKKGIVQLKKAENLIIGLLNDPKSRWQWNILNEVLSLIREVGALSKEVNG
ncbi:hypothetical protein [Candidatus Borrarchaeum sp.]|uniref:hypothetical protein n=1 Tax=Candidatus Borrarchaeum sp. TaxID=2846742 RepID=UPI00257C1213|nr:hypothetical protein [Candidatus Borrarchaeum sp.]